jgi:D-alanyl-D-alanine carboxypeptidase
MAAATLAVVFFSSADTTVAQAPSPGSPSAVPTAALTAAIPGILNLDHTPSASVAIAVKGKVVYERAFGVRDIARKLSADVNTHYEIGSITKQFTAAAVLQLQEDGKLSIDDRVATYLPDAPHAKQITVRQLLAQTSGLADYVDNANLSSVETFLSTTKGGYANVVAIVARKPLQFTPGSQWRYSNTNFIFLGEIIERVSHDSLWEYIRTHELAPAGMTHTSTIGRQSELSDMAVGYNLRSHREAVALTLGESWAGAAGDLVSTAGDVAAWNTALISGKIVSPRDYTLMSTAGTTSKGTSTGYGFGLFRDTSEGQPRVWHSGGTFGFNSVAEYFPKQSTAIVVLTNSFDAMPESVALKIFNILNPQIAAAEQRAVTGEDLAITGRVRAFIAALLRGVLKRSQITPAMSKAYSDADVKRMSEQMMRFGAPVSYTYKGKTADAHGVTYAYLVHFKNDLLLLTMKVDGATKKFSDFDFENP